MGRDEHRCAEPIEEVVQALEVPIGIGQRPRSGAQTRRKPFGNEGAGVRHGNEERRRAGAVLVELHQSEGSSPGANRWKAPASTSAWMAVISGARERSRA